VHSHRKSIAIVTIALMLLASCGQTTVAPTLQATMSPTPIATPVRVTVVVTPAPTVTPVPTDTPEPNAGTVLLVFGQDFIYDIYAVVRPAFEEVGYHVVVASRTMGPLQGKNVGLEVEVDLLLEDVRVKDYDAILFNCDNDVTFGSARTETDRIAQEAVAQGKVLAAICSGPRVLAYAGVVAGLQTTGEPSQTCAMLEQSGATCTGAEVERDGWVITARDRYAGRVFVQTILEAMQEQFVPSPEGGGGEGLIAFVSDRDGNGEIYVMNADGSNQRRLTHFRDFDGVPTWSPDGQRLAFYTHLSHSKWIIQAMDPDGSNQRPLTDNDACDGAPFWSPDGTRIAFTSAFDCDPDNREIVVMNTDGSDQVKLTDNDVDDYLSAWSPDSQRIAFVSDRDGNDEIYTMMADGSDPRRLTFDDAHDHMPAWSPDGVQIAFVSDRDGDDEIYVMDAGGGNLRRLTDNDADDWFPSWSPDGAQLLFSSRRDGGDLDV
jgi:putative intracellular protease/amidase